jgi:hypothetical protein
MEQTDATSRKTSLPIPRFLAAKEKSLRIERWLGVEPDPSDLLVPFRWNSWDVAGFDASQATPFTTVL